jgi:hypothetical protein
MDGQPGRHTLESLLPNPIPRILEEVLRHALLQIDGLPADSLHENLGVFAVAARR